MNLRHVKTLVICSGYLVMTINVTAHVNGLGCSVNLLVVTII